jgi:hypothetical protein
MSMELILNETLFKDDEYTVHYGNRTATFTIIDEELAGHHRLGRLNRINCVVREFNEAGEETGAQIGMPVIGLGDMIVGVRSGEPSLRGKLLNRENMDRCTVILYEEA